MSDDEYSDEYSEEYAFYDDYYEDDDLVPFPFSSPSPTLSFPFPSLPFLRPLFPASHLSRNFLFLFAWIKERLTRERGIANYKRQR